MSREFAYILMTVLIVGAFILAFSLSGCASPAPVVVGKVDTVTVDKAVAVGCLKPEDVPVVPGKAKLPAGADTKQKAAAAALELEQRRFYDDQASKLLANCTKVGP